MDDQRMRDALRPLARELLPVDQERKQAAIRNAFDAAGGLKPDAIRRSLPPLVLTWYLPGAVASGTNVGAETELAGDIRITQIAIRAKVAPSGTCKARLTASGETVEDVSLTAGQTGGRSTVRGEQAIRRAGQVLRIDIVSAGGAQGVTVTVSYTVADS